MAERKLIALFHKHLDKRGYINVKSMATGKEQPPVFTLEHEKVTLKPDVSAEIRGKKLVYEFVKAQPSQKQNLIEKCRNYMKLSAEQGFKFRLIVPSDRYDSVLQWINSNRLEQVGIVRVNLKSNQL